MAFAALIESIPSYDYYVAKTNIDSGKPVTNAERTLVAKYEAIQKESASAGSKFLIYDRFQYIVSGLAITLGLLGSGSLCGTVAYRGP